MRVGILTLHLHNNYGAIIQAAALYRFLEDHGFEPVLLRKEPENRSKIGRIIRNFLRHVPFQNFGQVRAREKERARHYPFIRRFIPNITRPCHNSRELKAVSDQYRIKAVVVGSDQVWRPEYHFDDNSVAYFLDFVAKPTLKLSYAASFGYTDWEHPDLKHKVSDLLADFDAVSVRENSGIEICRNEFGRLQCELVLDPTLLVDPRLYAEAAAPPQHRLEPSLVEYILDRSYNSEIACQSVKDALAGKYETTTISVEGEGKKVDIEHWLRAFMDADFVITDSYHGMLFAIIFDKQFIAFGNRKRGLDRFTTILDNIGIRDRLILDYDRTKIQELIAWPIEYDELKPRLSKFRELSEDFLLRNLSRTSAPQGGLPRASS